jgi:hypothetical protein
MVRGTPVGDWVIGRDVFDGDGRRLGQVIAVIHKAQGADVLVEGRHWLKRRAYRFRLDELAVWTDRSLVVATAASGVPSDALGTEHPEWRAGQR